MFGDFCLFSSLQFLRAVSIKSKQHYDEVDRTIVDETDMMTDYFEV